MAVTLASMVVTLASMAVTLASMAVTLASMARARTIMNVNHCGRMSAMHSRGRGGGSDTIQLLRYPKNMGMLPLLA